MSNYSDDELDRYFRDPSVRRKADAAGGGRRPSRGLRGFFHRKYANEDKAQAAFALSLVVAAIVAVTLFVGGWILLLSDDMPSFEQLDNPDLQLATIAYTADNRELARYAFQNRSWVSYEEISPHVINALVATEDRRFYNHWGIDVRGIFSALADIVTEFDLRGASTISQQLARNLYNQDIGFEVSFSRKLKEAITALQLERRYTKREIIEMYLNTVPFSNNAYGIEAAAQTYFSKPVADLSPLEGATLIGMLQATTYYNPYRNPENAQRRRNVVLSQMMGEGYISRAFYEEHREDPVVTDYNPSSELTSSLAPYFAEQVRLWMREWAAENGFNLYSDGLRVFTPLDSRMQEMAKQSVDVNMVGLQSVVDYEWSDGGMRFTELEPYLRQTGYEPWASFWRNNPDFVISFIRGTERYRSMRRSTDLSISEAVAELRSNEAFMDSLRTAKTRLEAGLVSINPHNGYIKAWVGGRDLEIEWYDHVNKAARQPGSTFKPFVYTAAIDNGWSPYYRLPDSTLTYVDPVTRQVWQPTNFGGSSGRQMTLAEALATSTNTVTARVITQLVNPSQVAFYARRMGIESPLDEVPALALGTSDVTLLEMTTAYSTLANGGLRYDPVFVTRIEDRYGNVLYEHNPTPEEAISEETAYTVVNMMRGVINQPNGTGQRVRHQYGLGNFDLAGKTGTTQESADGWFMLMHPDLVTGAWVGFNDRRVTFRTNWWGQGAHNALFLVGDYFRRLVDAQDIVISEERFPRPEELGVTFEEPRVEDLDDRRDPNDAGDFNDRNDNGDRRVGW
ncbi:MAG: PBP1A family penicillin-binding protein [Rhodothermales bacterium]